MKICKLEIKNIRNFKDLKLDLNYPLVIINGENAAGKTNLLESIYFLALTKSFKKGKEIDVILKGEELGIIKGFFETEDKENLEIEFVINTKKISKLNGAVRPMKDIIGNAEIVIFTVDDLDIINEPSKKRRFLNILISLLDKKYFFDLSEYEKVIKRRNKTLILLRLGRSKIQELDFWNERIANLGESIIRKRKSIIDKINEILKSSAFFDKLLFLQYEPQCFSAEKIMRQLKERIERDVAMGQTTVGPHRDIIKFNLGGLDLESYGSRGEKRSAIIDLKRAEIELIKTEKNILPIFLLDDVFSELDSNNTNNVLKLIGNQQTIITTIHLDNVKDFFKKAKIYKIENGEIKNDQ